MKELVEAFYDLSVLEEQQTVPNKETFNFSNMLIDLITEHAPALEKKEYHTGNKTAGLFHLHIFRPEYGRADFAKPADKCNEVFGREHKNRFYTGDTSRHDGSTGVGLAVVKALVLALDGNVGASVQDNNLKIILEL